MPKKRKSGGRSGGKRGRASAKTCASCGGTVATDKAKKYTVFSSAVDYRLAKELRSEGAHIPRQQKIVYYCVSCAIHKGRTNIRAKKERHD
ncbi:MAG: 30S ribosomal protein S26e [Candidatus Heimdallarchaeota archaeon]|nr:30S ribosomal protein S26e [Candidatus Heimdallarchaeota archaeon]